jgi:hypothetical protein
MVMSDSAVLAQELGRLNEDFRLAQYVELALHVHGCGPGHENARESGHGYVNVNPMFDLRKRH